LTLPVLTGRFTVGEFVVGDGSVGDESLHVTQMSAAPQIDSNRG
jgi:hypothetical protein